jgi:hypothetical protein
MLYICEGFILRKGEIVRLSENIRVNSNITEGGDYASLIVEEIQGFASGDTLLIYDVQ